MTKLFRVEVLTKNKGYTSTTVTSNTLSGCVECMARNREKETGKMFVNEETGKNGHLFVLLNSPFRIS